MALVTFVNDSAPYLSAENLNNNFEYLDDKIPNIVNQHSNSQEDAYSCDYINDCNTYSSIETDTGEIEIVNNVEYHRYRKVLRFTSTSTANSWTTVGTNITNLYEMLEVKAKIDRSNYVNAVPFKENDTTFVDLSFVIGSTNISYRVGSAMTGLPMRVELTYIKSS